jgi:CheY-like chemotaxis protein
VGMEKTVLIVDDEKDICELLGFQLQREGLKSFSANSGSEALVFLSSNKVDLIISDVRMPNGDGPSLLKSLRASGNNTPLIFLSGFADIDDPGAKSLGAIGLVAKPVNKTKMKVLLFGSTGLVGSHLLSILSSEPFSALAPIRISAQRSSYGPSQIPVSFDNLDVLGEYGPFDSVFYCIGTTHRNAGSKSAFQEIELKVSSQVIEFARRQKIPTFLLLSSQGANSRSSYSYMKTKGMIEDHAITAGFKAVGIFRPSLLLGHRNEKRYLETLAQSVLRPMSGALQRILPGVSPIGAEQVAKAMKKAALSGFSGTKIFENKDLIDLSN